MLQLFFVLGGMGERVFHRVERTAGRERMRRGRQHSREEDGLKEEKLRQKVLRQIYDLAFGENNDAARLIFMDEEEARFCMAHMDLRRVVSMHRAANGGVEVKFADRAELIELLLEATEEKAAAADSGGAGLLEAINRAAERMGGRDEDEEEVVE